MKNYIFFVILYLSVSTSAQVPEWIKPRECSGLDRIFCYTDVAADDNKNIYSVGFSWAIVGSDNFDSKIIISKTSSQGNTILEKSYPVSPSNNRHDDYLYSTTVAKIGSLSFLVSGGESNGNAYLMSVKSSDLSYHNRANISGDGHGTSKITSVCYFNNFIYVIGTFKGNIKFRNPGQNNIKKAFTSGGIEDIFVAKFSPGCGFSDAIQLKGTPGNYQNCFDLKIDSNENLYFSIATGCNIDVSNQHLYSTYSGNGNYDLCIVKLNKLLPISCNKIATGPQASFELNRAFFNNNLTTSSIGGVFLNSFQELFFPIALSSNNLLCYFAVSFLNQNGPNIVGKFDIQSQASTFSQDNVLFPNNPINSTMVTDIEVSQCDSIYLSVLVSNSSHAGVFQHSILSMNSTTFFIHNGLKSSDSNIRGSKICIDKDRNVFFTGFFGVQI